MASEDETSDSDLEEGHFWVIWVGHFGNKFDEFLSFGFCLRFMVFPFLNYFTDSIMAHINPCNIFSNISFNYFCL